MPANDACQIPDAQVCTAQDALCSPEEVVKVLPALQGWPVAQEVCYHRWLATFWGTHVGHQEPACDMGDLWAPCLATESSVCSCNWGATAAGMLGPSMACCCPTAQACPNLTSPLHRSKRPWSEPAGRPLQQVGRQLAAHGRCCLTDQHLAILLGLDPLASAGRQVTATQPAHLSRDGSRSTGGRTPSGPSEPGGSVTPAL